MWKFVLDGAHPWTIQEVDLRFFSFLAGEVFVLSILLLYLPAAFDMDCFGFSALITFESVPYQVSI